MYKEKNWFHIRLNLVNLPQGTVTCLNLNCRPKTQEFLLNSQLGVGKPPFCKPQPNPARPHNCSITLSPWCPHLDFFLTIHGLHYSLSLSLFLIKTIILSTCPIEIEIFFFHLHQSVFSVVKIKRERKEMGQSDLFDSLKI